MYLSASKFAEENNFFGLDWTGRGLLAGTEEITASSWSAPPDLTLGSPSFTAVQTRVLVGGGIAGSTYEISNTITTQSGQTMKTVLMLEIVS
jgi:hypothetical protein